MENKETFPATMQQAAELTTGHPAVIAAAEARTAFMFEAVILDETEPIRITADSIRKKSKALTDLSIENIFDTKGYAEVKKAYNKAVKTRTCIEKLEAPKKKEYKTAYDEKVKELTDYTSSLYAACREVEENLKGKYTAIDTAIVAEQKRLADEKKAKTDGRDTSMYAAGMRFNGIAFIGHDKAITKEMLHTMEDKPYAALLEELTLANEAAQITGKVQESGPPIPPVRMSYGGGSSWPSSTTPKAPVPAAPPMDIIYETAVPDCGVRIFITRGVISAEADALVANEEINESGFFMQITR